MAHQPHTNDLSEAAVIDNEAGAAATPIARTPYLPTTLPMAHVEIVSLNCEVTLLRKHISERDAIIGRKVAYLTQLELAAKYESERMENLSLTVRDLEAALIKRDAELVEKRTALIYQSNQTINAEARVESLQMCVDTLRDKVTRRDETIEELTGEHADARSNVQHLMERIDGYERDMAGTLERIAELESSLAMMIEIADVAAKDADKNLDNARDLSVLLDDSVKREDRAHETLIGIRAFAESTSLCDHEKVALILRLLVA